jgi:hypothetical protein
VFVGDEMRLDVGYAIARERLMRLADGGTLLSTSEDAYDHAAAGLAKVGMPGLSKLVRVQVRELTRTEGSAALAIRWEATGPGGGLFPVLDADITLAPAADAGEAADAADAGEAGDFGDAQDGATVLTMAGVYRPPLGALGQALDRALLHHIALATIRGFLAGLAARIAGQPSDHVAIQGGWEPWSGPSTPEVNT